MAQAGTAYRSAGYVAAKRDNRRERAVRLNRMMIRVMVGITMVCLFGYISRMAVISSKAKEISRIRAEITSLREDQQQLETQLAAALNPSRVRDEAFGRLGMVYPGEGQVRVISLNGLSAGANTQTALENAVP